MAQSILLIDDSKSVHILVKAALSGDGYETHGAFDGISGIESAKLLRPDLILLDVEMPGMDGYDVCELLSVQPETASVPVIFLSGNSDAAARVKALHMGATDYIIKPFHPDELRGRIRVSLRYRMLLEMESRRAMRDGLTGLWNRTYFDQQLTALSAGSVRHGWPLSCVMLDIDHFKSFNDTYGHTFGDEAIRAVAAIIGTGCRQEDVVCRYGGEEFVILCPGVPSLGATNLAERLRTAIEGRSLKGPTGPLHATCSFGIASGPTGTALLETADRMLYEAKHAGRNCVRVYSEITHKEQSAAA